VRKDIKKEIKELKTWIAQENAELRKEIHAVGHE
jgi:hypothetical protein